MVQHLVDRFEILVLREGLNEERKQWTCAILHVVIFLVGWICAYDVGRRKTNITRFQQREWHSSIEVPTTQLTSVSIFGNLPDLS